MTRTHHGDGDEPMAVETPTLAMYADYWSEGYAPTLYIDTAEWLKCVSDADDETAVAMQAEIDALYEAPRGAYDPYPGADEIGEHLCALHGMRMGHRSNTYNYDNDLSSDFDYLIIGEDIGDPYASPQYLIYADHLGGDIRGNYSQYRIALLYSPDDAYYGDMSIEVWVREVLPEAPQSDALFDAGNRRYAQEQDFDNLYSFGSWLERECGTDFDSDTLFPPMPKGIHEVPNVLVTDNEGVVWECMFSNRALMSC